MLAIATLLLLINILAFISMWIDKLRAVHNGQSSGLSKSRISEVNLHLLSLAGGFIGSFLAMKVFRHKTQKTAFKVVQFLICLLWMTLLCTLIYFTNFNH
jgi:uncharacterized membrane protein YsdA (DUF1294 family)